MERNNGNDHWVEQIALDSTVINEAIGELHLIPSSTRREQLLYSNLKLQAPVSKVNQVHFRNFFVYKGCLHYIYSAFNHYLGGKSAIYNTNYHYYYYFHFYLSSGCDNRTRGGGGALRYRGGRIRSLAKFKNTPKALIPGQKSTLILIKTLTFSSK